MNNQVIDSYTGSCWDDRECVAVEQNVNNGAQVPTFSLGEPIVVGGQMRYALEPA